MKTIAYLSLIYVFILMFIFDTNAQNNDIYHLKYKTCTECNSENPQYSTPIEFVTSLITEKLTLYIIEQKKGIEILKSEIINK